MNTLALVQSFLVAHRLAKSSLCHLGCLVDRGLCVLVGLLVLVPLAQSSLRPLRCLVERGLRALVVRPSPSRVATASGADAGRSNAFGKVDVATASGPDTKKSSNDPWHPRSNSCNIAGLSITHRNTPCHIAAEDLTHLAKRQLGGAIGVEILNIFLIDANQSLRIPEQSDVLLHRKSFLNLCRFCISSFFISFFSCRHPLGRESCF
jgi:hypothetical protein